MTDLDKQIQEALDAEDRALFDELGEQGLLGQFASVFKGKMGWVSAASVLVGTILTAASFYAAWNFFTIPDADAKLGWGALAWFLMTMVAFMKVWFWMRMESNRVLREIKRVELQLARLQLK